MEFEQELVFISDSEFANIVQKLKVLKKFSGKKVQNKYQLVTKEVFEHKYDDAYLDFEKCSSLEKQKLRNDYMRIEKALQRNSRHGKDLSFGLDGSRPFISSEFYPTLVVSPPRFLEIER